MSKSSNYKLLFNNAPVIVEATLYQYTHLIVNIPKGTLSKYQETTNWKNFWNLNETLPSPNVKEEQIILNLESVELNIGETFQLEATVLPEDTTDKTITWTSSNTDVATVSENGLVSGMSIGETLITATCGEVSAECKITVLTPVIYPEEIILNIEEAQLLVGDVLQLEASGKEVRINLEIKETGDNFSWTFEPDGEIEFTYKENE